MTDGRLSSDAATPATRQLSAPPVADAVRDDTTTALATLVAATTGVVGAWLPWSRKLPAGYTDGVPYYTMEYTPGSVTGFDPFAAVAAAVVVVTAGLTVAALWRGRSPTPPALGGGGVLIAAAVVLGREYRGGDRLAVDWGLPLVGAAGFLFVLVGLWCVSVV